MTVLERLGGREAITRGIVEEFRALSRHPHPSWHEGATGEDLFQRMAALGLHPQRDESGNLMADVPPSPGREGSRPLILQGHMDMVCAVAPDSGFDPLNHPVAVQEEDGFLCSDGRSSLGADNMLGNATVFWLLSTGQVAHGPLRLIFTIAEEVGLEGAKRVDPAWLTGAEWLLNTDGFKLGRAILGSASGRRETYARPLDTQPCQGGRAWRLSLTGGMGGHSGDDIHLGRANCVKLLGKFLSALEQESSYALAALEGGATHNAIPAQGAAVVVLPADGEDKLRKVVEEFSRTVRETYAADPGLTVTLAPVPLPGRVWTTSCQTDTVALINALFNGVYAMHPAFPQTVGASANVGRVWVSGGQIQICAFLRCTSQADEDLLAAGHDGAAAAGCFTAGISGYPGWPGLGENPLAARLARIWKAQTGRDLELGAVHVGLEPSVFQAKNPALVMVSTGPDIWNAHSVEERAPLAGLPDYALLLAGLLEDL